MTLIAEDLLLLLLDDQSGKPNTSHLDLALGGAVLVDLALGGLVEVASHGSLLGSAKLRRAPGAMVGDRILAGALGAVAENKPAQRLVVKVGKGLLEPLAERQLRRGVLDRREEKVLGLVTRTRWPSRDPSRKEAIRRALVVILVQGGRPDARSAALIGLLLAVNRLHRTVSHPDASARRVKRRAKEVAEESWASPTIKDAVAVATAATAAAHSTAVNGE
ncbi:MAG TPA: GPP34 family phosphoprotein [Nocardioides sp.]|nr:GPP34 family phosphoprotein [Nocardioides sp.]